MVATTSPSSAGATANTTNTVRPPTRRRVFRNKRATRLLVVFVFPLLFILFVSVPWILSWHLDEKQYHAISSSLSSSKGFDRRDSKRNPQQVEQAWHSSPHNLVSQQLQAHVQKQLQQQQNSIDVDSSRLLDAIHKNNSDIVSQKLIPQGQRIPQGKKEDGRSSLSGMIGNNLHLLISQQRKQLDSDLNDEFVIPVDTTKSNRRNTIINDKIDTNFNFVNSTANMDRLPEWMKDYFAWHNEQVRQLTVHNWNDTTASNPVRRRFQFIVLRCFVQDERCGGLSDRLKPLPLMVLAASQSRRILYISWTRPCPLEEFIVPGLAINWTVPDWLLKEFMNPSSSDNEQRLVTRAQALLSTVKQIQYDTVFVHLHDGFGGSTHYNQELQSTTAFEAVYHDLWRSMMKPSKAIRQRINELVLSSTSSNHQHHVSDPFEIEQQPAQKAVLVPGMYAVAHFRAEYGKEVVRHPVLSTTKFLTNVALNALYCASELYPGGGPIYFASDSIIALQAVRNFSSFSSRSIITFDRDEDEPLHLDKMEIEEGGGGGLRSQLEYAEQRRIEERNNKFAEVDDITQSTDNKTNTSSTRTAAANTTTRPTKPSDYYSTFVDFYIAGNGVCVAYGRGGFGRYANILSYNWTCAKRHVKNFFPEKCEWHD